MYKTRLSPKLCYVYEQNKTHGYSEEGMRGGREFKPLDSDVAVDTFPKAGTTWTQQICHQLRSGGDESFGEILDAVPHFEETHDIDGEITGTQEPFSPRLFKSHWSAMFLPPFKRIVYVMRDPLDVALSFYNYAVGYAIKEGDLTLEEVTEVMLLNFTCTSSFEYEGEQSIYHHMLGMVEKQKEDPGSVLLVFYEDMKENLEREVTRMAKYLSSDTERHDTPEKIAAALKYSSFEYMKKNEEKFGGAHCRDKFNAKYGLNRTNKTKMKNGKSGEGKKMLNDECKEKMAKRWEEVMVPSTGCANYEAFRMKYRHSCPVDKN